MIGAIQLFLGLVLAVAIGPLIIGRLAVLTYKLIIRIRGAP